VAARRDAGLGEVTRVRLVDLARVDRAVRQLDGRVAVGVRGLDLGDDARSRLDDGDRNHPVRCVENLGHSQLLAQDSLGVGGH